MENIKNELEDELRPEYDLKTLRVRRVGSERMKLGGQFVHLAPDVAELFPNSESVNEALRLLIRITRDNSALLSKASANA